MRYNSIEKKLKQCKQIDYGVLGSPANVNLEEDNKLFISSFAIALAYEKENNQEKKEKLKEMYERICLFFSELNMHAKNNDFIKFSEMLDIRKVSEVVGTCANISPLGYGKSNSNNGKGLEDSHIRKWFSQFKKYNILVPEYFEFAIEGVGEDRVSDLLTNIIGDILIDYTDCAISQMNVASNYEGYRVGIDLGTLPRYEDTIHYWDRSWKQKKVKFYIGNNFSSRIQILIPESITLKGQNYDGIDIHSTGNIKRYSSTIVRDIIIEEFIERKTFEKLGINVKETLLRDLEVCIKREIGICGFQGIDALIKLGGFLQLSDQEFQDKLQLWFSEIQKGIMKKIRK